MPLFFRNSPNLTPLQVLLQTGTQNGSLAVLQNVTIQAPSGIARFAKQPVQLHPLRTAILPFNKYFGPMKYTHISQKPYCCVPACVQMILRRRKMPIFGQTDIAYDLGVVLPPKDRYLLPKSHRGLKPKSGWGTRIDLKKYSLTAFFKRHGFPLHEKYFSAKRFLSTKQFKKFLLENIGKGNDLLVCFNSPLLYHREGSWGHASLIEEVEEESVTLRDPKPQYKLARRVLLNDLLAALKNHYHGGIWVVSDLKYI